MDCRAAVLDLLRLAQAKAAPGWLGFKIWASSDRSNSANSSAVTASCKIALRTGQENIAEQALVLRKHAVQNGDDLAFAVTDLLDQPKAEA